jgi:1-deoxy-D-xylulose-5-phosphate reductoisomerase
MNTRIGVTILGSTGSIGVNTLDVLSRHADRFQVMALTARCDVDGLFQQCLDVNPAYAVMVDAAAAEQLHLRLQAAGRMVEVLAGADALERVATLPETAYVMAAIVGAAGLLPTLAAARAGKRVLLANKEALVMAGPLFMAAVREHGSELLPMDSEHNAIFQCLPPDFATAGLETCGVRRILLTGSGGPFRLTPLEQLPQVTPEQACAHPNWRMGRKISVDSATMMNKGLEVIEAHWLFGAPISADRSGGASAKRDSLNGRIRGWVGVGATGSSRYAHPDCSCPGLAATLASGTSFLDFARLATLEFQAPDLARFPCLRLAFAALEAGGTRLPF